MKKKLKHLLSCTSKILLSALYSSYLIYLPYLFHYYYDNNSGIYLLPNQTPLGIEMHF